MCTSISAVPCLIALFLSGAACLPAPNFRNKWETSVLQTQFSPDQQLSLPLCTNWRVLKLDLATSALTFNLRARQILTSALQSLIFSLGKQRNGKSKSADKLKTLGQFQSESAKISAMARYYKDQTSNLKPRPVIDTFRPYLARQASRKGARCYHSCA